MALIIALLVLTLLSFGRILLLSFGWDDYTSLYYAAHTIPLQFPYYADNLRFLPLFRLFDLAPTPYYIISLALFFADVLLLTLLTYQITRHRLLAFTSAVLFIFSFVGSDSMYYVAEGLRNTQFLLILFVTLLAYLHFLQRHGPKFFFASFAGFLLLTVVFPYRAFFVLPVLFIFDRYAIKKSDTMAATAKRMLPLALVWLFMYLAVPNLPGVKNMMGHIHPTSFLSTPLGIHLRNFSLTWLYVFIPSSFFAAKPALPWIGTAIYLALASFLYHSRPSAYSRFSRINFWVLAIILLSFVLVVNDAFTTEYRYLLVARPFAAMLIAGLLFHGLCGNNRKLFASWIIIFFLVVSLVLHVSEHFAYQAQIITMRGSYAKKAIATILTNVPNIRGNTLFFLDAENNELRHRFTEAVIVGTLPAGASLATYYNTDYKYIEIADYVHCDVFQSVLKTWEGQPMDLYYFYAQEKRITQGPKERAFERCNMKPTFPAVFVR